MSDLFRPNGEQQGQMHYSWSAPESLTVSICQSCLCRCCPTALKTLLGHGRRRRKGCVDHNAAYSQFIIQLCCRHRGGGAGGRGGGVSSRKESIGRLRRRNSFIVFQSDETLFLWKSQLLTQQHRLRPNSSTCVSPTEWQDERDEGEEAVGMSKTETL